MQKDYYKVLGVSKQAKLDDIKQAFKKLARQYHPDVNPDKGAEDKFKEISEAYEVLGDEKKRKQYDQFGSFDFGGKGPHNPFTQTYWQSVNINDFDIEDIFGDIFGMGGPKRGQRAGKIKYDFDFGGRSHRASDGADVQWTLPIEFLEAVNGTEKQILLSDGKKIKVKIPAGVDTGSKIRLTGKGHPGVAGGRSGNLIIETEVKAHKYFRREGQDIHLDVDISLSEAIEGSKITVPTIQGNVELKIPKCSQGGQVMRLKDKGVKNLKDGSCGHQFVHLNIKYPPKLSDKEIDEITKIMDRHSLEVRKW